MSGGMVQAMMRKSTETRLPFGALMMMLLFMASAQASGIFRVDAASSAATPDGQSWAKAYRTLQAGVDAAETASGGEVWVRQGIYVANTDPVLTLKGGVSLYGGFAGTESARTKRNWTANITAIDGGNTRCCVAGADNATLDGFTVTHGKSTLGGGMYNSAASPTVVNCTFVQNSASYEGGGMYNSSCSPVVVNCLFVQNSASQGGGGMNNYLSSATTVTNCTFIGNTAGVDGGGMDNYYSQPSVTNCTFTQNSAIHYGGGMNNSQSALPTLVNCILWSDAAENGPELFNDSSTSAVSYSCVQGGFAGTGNVSGDPLFVDGGNGGSVQLRTGSPCVDSGTDSGAPATDLNGTLRPQGVRVDMGAYEGAAAPADLVTLTLKVLPTDGGRTSPPAGLHSYVRGETASVSALGLGMGFAGWTGAVTGTALQIAVTIGGDKTITANFAQNIVFVDIGNTAGPWDGHSWATALQDIQAGLNAAQAEGGGELWVATGDYTAATDPVVTMVPGVSLYGGFAGTESARISRNWTANPTAIDGEDAHGCVVGATDATLDGFTITHGRTDYGGGMCNYSLSSATVANCVFAQNTADVSGGGMYNAGDSSTVVTNCTFTQNTSINSSGVQGGGGMCNDSFASPVLMNCVFTSNSSSSYGAAMRNNPFSSPHVTNCVFRQNSGAYYGGAMYNDSSSEPVLMNCSFTQNGATAAGGAMYNYASSPRITNSILWADSAPSGPEMYNSAATPIVAYSCVKGNFSGTGNTGADPRFVDASGGNLRLQDLSPCIDKGTATDAPAADFAGVARPQGPGVDIGAYEHIPPAVTGSILINNDAKCTTVTQVTLSLAWASGSGLAVTSMRFSDDGAHWTAWEAVAPTRAYTLPWADGHHTVRAQFRDAAGDLSERLADYILLDKTAPTGTIVINGGAAATSNPVVTLSLTWNDGAVGSGVVRMRFSDNGATWTPWEVLKATKTHTLPLPPGGHQTVRVQYRDGAGNISARYSDYIRLDTP